MSTQNNNIYTSFNIDQDIVQCTNKVVTDNMFSKTGSFIATTQSESYYASLYQNNTSSQMPAYNVAVGVSTYNAGCIPSYVIYNQFKSLLYNQPQTTSSMTLYSSGSSSPVSRFLAITFRRDLIKDSLNLGSLSFNVYGTGTSSLKDYKLADCTNLPTNILNLNSKINYNDISLVVKSTVASASAVTSSLQICGFAYSKLGLIFLDVTNNSSIFPSNLNSSTTQATITSNALTAINNSTQVFSVRNQEYPKSKYYVCRIKNKRYNFSNNPTWATQQDTRLVVRSDMRNNPITYITTVGLYNDNGELLAIAKLNKPYQKSFDRDFTIKVRIDF